MTIGEEIQRNGTRDTKTFYLKAPENIVSSNLISFARKYCGKRILDLGCATGHYILELDKLGFDCVGADVNPEYVEIARKRGLEVYLIDQNLPFEDKSFDSVIMFEVLEHLSDINSVLAEARRVARKNIILTVPNCEGYDKLKQYGLAFEHFLDLDHKNFFTPALMREALSLSFSDFDILCGDPLLPHALMNKSPVSFLLKGLYKVKLLTPRYYFRLYVIIRLTGDE